MRALQHHHQHAPKLGFHQAFPSPFCQALRPPCSTAHSLKPRTHQTPCTHSRHTKATENDVPSPAAPPAPAPPSIPRLAARVTGKQVLTGMAALTSCVEVCSLVACVLCCVQLMHMHGESVALQQVAEEQSREMLTKKPERQIQTVTASTWIPSPEWTWQWQQLGGLQACLLTCALLARVVAGLLWGVVRRDQPTSRVTQTSASLETSARVLRLEAIIAKQQQALDSVARQADKATLAGRLHRHDIKHPTSQMQASISRHNEILVKLTAAQEKLEKQIQDTQMLLGAMQTVSERQFEVTIQAVQQLRTQQAQLQQSLRAAVSASKEARDATPTAGAPAAQGEAPSSARAPTKTSAPGGIDTGSSNTGAGASGGSMQGPLSSGRERLEQGSNGRGDPQRADSSSSSSSSSKDEDKSSSPAGASRSYPSYSDPWLMSAPAVSSSGQQRPGVGSSSEGLAGGSVGGEGAGGIVGSLVLLLAGSMEFVSSISSTFLERGP